jgi:hypothetical protein
MQVGNIIINIDKVINITKKLITHGKKELCDDDGEEYGARTQYAIVIKETEEHKNFLYYTSKEERDEAFDKLVRLLVFKEEVRS